MDSPHGVKRTKTALLAEDDPSVRPYLSVLLQQQGFVVLPACDGTEALGIFHAFSGQIDLLVTDVNMGDGPDGIDLARQLLREQPGLPVLVVSGTLESEGMAAENGFPFLAKPFALRAFVDRVNQVLAGSPSPDKGRTAGSG